MIGIQHDKTPLLRRVLKSGAFLVDVRTEEEVKDGGVKNAVNIPMEDVPKRLSEFEDKANIVVFCRSGARSQFVKEFLSAQGFDRVFNGGRWQDVAELTDKV